MTMQNVYMYILANKCWITCKFSHCKFWGYKGTFSTPKSDQQLVIWAVCSSASSIWPQTHVAWNKVFYFKHTLCTHTTKSSLSSWKAHYSTSLRSCLYYSKYYSWIFAPGLVCRCIRDATHHCLNSVDNRCYIGSRLSYVATYYKPRSLITLYGS